MQMNGEAESSDTSSCETDGSVGLRQPHPTDLGKRVLFYSSQDKKEKYGVLRYIGKPEFADGTWCGVELDGPRGKNNGSLQGIRYFSCETNYGVFVPASKVELDTTRRKRPPSTEIKRKNSSGNLFIPSGISKLGSAPSVQQEMVQRLAQPAMGDRFTKRKNPQSSVTSRKLPLKAFAPKGMSKDDTLPRQSKKTPAVPSFRSGGMYRTQSTENIRKLKDKGEVVQAKPKKSSSEKDLRSSSKLNDKTNVLVKPRRKPTRPTSAADLTGVSKTTTSESSAAKTRHSSVEPWPKTSTPSTSRDDSTPDGCSSPDEGSESFSSHDISTGNSQEMSAEPSELDSGAIAASLAFIATSESSNKGKPLPDASKVAIPTGLATPAKELAESERSAPTQDPCRVPSPELCPKTRYNNRPSGTATLQHPLTQTSNAPEAVNGYVCDGTLDLSQSVSCFPVQLPLWLDNSHASKAPLWFLKQGVVVNNILT